jgi:N-acetylglucosaminyldiphosphoundecaprenol N-acetyl-beta-D-mannosaminyltransferase
MGSPEGKGRTILGIDFFTGSVEEAIAILETGGLLVVPAAPGLESLPYDREYRESLLGADLAITDSAYMVLSWNLLQRDRVERLSGLRFQQRLLQSESFRAPGNTLWVMARPASAERNLSYLRSIGIEVPEECVYLAPVYSGRVEDQRLLELAERLQPKHILLSIGGGTQEKLGYFLKQHLSYRPAIYCTGAAIAFLSGDQVEIPGWADRLYLGWLVRIFSDPKVYVPRYWGARRLFQLIRRYRHRLPEAAG